jgi:putative tryptophan/tyrosine transport system substrate-binding protein
MADGTCELTRHLATFALVLVLLAPPLVSSAQQASRAPRIGYLDSGSAAAGTATLEAFRQGLRDLGWVEGQNIALEIRFAGGKHDQLPELAADLVRLKVDVIYASTTPAALAAKHATTTIPIVFGSVADPVGSGVVPSLARPGANVTGWTHLGLELRGKYLELLEETLPGATRMGALWNPANPVHVSSVSVLEAAARARALLVPRLLTASLRGSRLNKEIARCSEWSRRSK